jgi:hypothetical protein
LRKDLRFGLPMVQRSYYWGLRELFQLLAVLHANDDSGLWAAGEAGLSVCAR